MDLQVTQAELEARAAQIMKSNPNPNQLVSQIFGPMENWILKMGPYQLMLIPWTSMWWQYDRVHESWEPTGLEAGKFEFIQIGDEIEIRPVQAGQGGQVIPASEPIQAAPVQPVPTPIQPAAVQPAPAKVELPATMVEVPPERPNESLYGSATVVQEKPLVWRLLFLSGPKLNEKVVLGERLSLGREKDNDIILLDPKVSRHHAVIQHQGSDYILMDQGSSNGTILNNQRLGAPAALKNNDKITIGVSQIVVNVS